MGSPEKPNTLNLIRNWRHSTTARRILLDGGLLMAFLICTSWLSR